MRRGLGVVAAMITAGIAALSAAGGDVQGTDPAGDLKTPGLTRAERAALDIRSIRVVGEEGLGAFVTVTFAGNIERALGSGHLKQAVAGMVLRPRSTPATPAGLLARGGELVPLTVRLSAKRVVHVQATTEETYRKTRSTSVGIVRHANQLFFFVLGPGFSNVASVDVRTFASLPEKRAEQPGLATFTEGQPTDEETIEIDPSTLTADQLLDLKKAFADEVKDLTKTAENVEIAREHIDLLLHDIGNSNPAAGHLKSVFHALDKLNDNTLDKIRLLNGAINVIDAEIQSRASHMPMLIVSGSCVFFDPLEVMCSGTPNELVGDRAPAVAGSPIDALQMVVPGGRQISAFLCPSQLPSGSLSQTSTPNDTLTCTGVTLAVGQGFTFNLRTSPSPTAGMGVQVFARQDGTFKGPFAFSGP